MLAAWAWTPGCLEEEATRAYVKQQQWLESRCHIAGSPYRSYRRTLENTGAGIQFSLYALSDSLQPHGCSMPGFPAHHQLPELAQTHVHRVGDTIQPSHPLSSASPPAFNLSQHQTIFEGVSSSYQVAKVLEFQLQISPSNEYSGLISFRMQWLNLLAVQGTLKSLLQHHSSKSISSLVLSFLYNSTLTSIHDYWKNHSFV